MKMHEFRPGLRVYDRWWPEPTMEVVQVLKTRVKLLRDGEVRTYDKHHVQFLERAPPPRPSRSHEKAGEHRRG